MLTIRLSQMEAFEQSFVDRFAGDLAAYLKSHYALQAEAVGGDLELAAFVQRAIHRAVEYGIDTKGGVTILAELMIQFGEDFERSPLQTWTKNVLTHGVLPGPLKAETLHERYQDLTGGRPVVTY